VRHPVVRWVAALAVLGTGLTPTVTNYDATITSETVAVSLTVLLLAAWLRLLSAPSARTAAALVALAVLFTFTRNDHPWIVAAAASVAAIVAWRGHLGRRTWAVVAACLAVVSVWGVAAAGRNDEIERFNLAMVMANRVVPDVDLLEWFVERDMPLPRGVEPGLGLVGGDTTLAFAGDDRWNEWASDDGRRTYVQFLLTHLDHLLLEPWPDILGVRSTTLETQVEPVVLLSPGDAYGRSHRVVPEPVESLLWGPGDAGSLLVALAGLLVAGLVSVARRGRGAFERLGATRAFALAALALGAVHLFVVWHASPIELGRLAMVPSTTIHVAVLLLVAVTVDGRVSDAAELRQGPDADEGASDDV
jgi:hypothetical protein